MQKYAKDKLPRSPTQIKTYLRLQPAHLQYSTHCLKEITDSEKARIPVLVGYSIPRNDKEDQEIKYAVAMLALFKSWSNNKLLPLKPEGQTWVSAFKMWDSSTSARAHQKTMRNMQLQYESKDAKVDYSAMRRKQMAELCRLLPGSYKTFDDDSDMFDPEWENAMSTQVEQDTLHEEDLDDLPNNVLCILENTKTQGFYNIKRSLVQPTLLVNLTTLATLADKEAANEFRIALAKQKEEMVQA